MEGALIVAQERIVAVGLLTQRELDALGDSFSRAWPVDDTPCFSSLLRAIDEADRELWQQRDLAGLEPVADVEKPSPVQTHPFVRS